MSAERSTKQNVSRKLRELRTSQGLTQSSAAACFGIPMKRYATYEDGRSFPPYDTLKIIAQYYGLKSVDELVSGPTPVKTLPKGDLETKFHRAPAPVKRAIMAILSEY